MSWWQANRQRVGTWLFGAPLFALLVLSIAAVSTVAALVVVGVTFAVGCFISTHVP